MIRYILVDDEPKVLKRVQAKIDTLPKEYELEHLNSFDSSKKALEEVNADTYDLLIVDFEMPVYNGIELAQKIAANKKIIFLTSTTDNEQKVINRLDISGFLSKPFDIEEFEAILKNKIIGKVKAKTRFKKLDLVTIAVGATQDIGFCPDDTYYITSSRNEKGKQANKNYVHFFGAHDEVLTPNVRITIKELSKKLKHYDFERVNQSTLVNLTKFDKRISKKLYLKDCNETFDIGENEKTDIIMKLRQ